MKNFDSFYKQVERAIKQFNSQKREIERNGDLSATGRGKRINELKAELVKSLAGVQESFHRIAGDKEKEIHQRLGSADPREKLIHDAREKLFSEALKDNNLLGDPFLNDDLRSLVLADEIRGLRADLQKNMFLLQTTSLDSEKIRKVASEYYRQNELEKLQWLKESVIFREDSELVLKTINAYISELEQKALTPSQKIAVQELELLEKERALFNFAVEVANTRNAFVDPRRAEQGEKVISISPDLVERHSEQLTKLAKQDPQEFMRLQRENKLEQALEEEIKETS